MIKTFRGKLEDDEEDKLRLSTKKGKIGYRIIKFQIIGDDPQTHRQESVVKIMKITTTPTGTIDFSDGNLLGVAIHKNYEQAQYPFGEAIIFDRELFNQDIFVTHTDEGGSTRPCNYYIELETEALTDNAAAVSTLRDIRLNPQVGA